MKNQRPVYRMTETARRSARSLRYAGVALCLVQILACQTTPSSPREPELETLHAFSPATYHSGIHAGEARYPNLFSAESHAVWVGPEVAELKRMKALEMGEIITTDLDETARLVGEGYYVIECHMESLFPDASIAYDSVGLRAIDAYLQTPDGVRVSPIQRILGSHADEENVEALRRYRRTNILIFAKRDVMAQRAAIDAAVPRIRLVLEGFNSSFYFEWAAAPVEVDGRSWMPTASEAAESVKIGFTELFSKLRLLGQMFH